MFFNFFLCQIFQACCFQVFHGFSSVSRFSQVFTWLFLSVSRFILEFFKVSRF